MTSIGDYAFEICSSLTEMIYNAENCKTLGTNWLRDVPLQKLIIGTSVKSIPNNAFENCSSLTSITIPESITEIGNYAFSGCSSLTEMIYNAENCKTLSYNWLSNIPLQKLIIGTTVKSIPNSAFQDCSSLTEITIPENVTLIGDYAFLRCSSLKEFIVDDSNRYYTSKDGVLFSKDITTLITYPNAKASVYEIPESVTSIVDWAFSGCSDLTSITIPESVTSIGNYAFLYCI